ncbi:hypothetical protein M4I32_14390 [Microbacterium sp. LRZ72]|uniref:hypothetical protein n=1 Tax=Microbacterium sp. LRZ72 TaxID=2942481 RepID=UPI0029AE1D67|nr:hypothetical protein [Microbacterium sp. LRZ72]MDX2377983.1 hypothetical protein [Microbacterium sp. LRZ72]
MEEWAEEAAEQLARITREPMADAARGTVWIANASERRGRSRYQECALEVVAEAPDLPARTVQTAVVFDSRRYWPVIGTTLPARISRTHPDMVEVDWEAALR